MSELLEQIRNHVNNHELDIDPNCGYCNGMLKMDEITLSENEENKKSYEIVDGVVYLKEYSKSGQIGSFELFPWEIKQIAKEIEKVK